MYYILESLRNMNPTFFFFLVGLATAYTIFIKVLATPTTEVVILWDHDSQTWKPRTIVWSGCFDLVQIGEPVLGGPNHRNLHGSQSRPVLRHSCNHCCSYVKQQLREHQGLESTQATRLIQPVLGTDLHLQERGVIDHSKVVEPQLEIQTC